MDVFWSKIFWLTCRFKVSPQGFKSAHTDDASFSNVRALADASSCKAANKSTIQLQITAQKQKQRNHLQENVKKTIWTERSCVYFDETVIVESLIDKTAWFRKFAHARIAIFASSYSDDIIAIEVKKQKNSYQISRISFGEIP